MEAALDGWQLAACVIVGVIVLGVLLVLLIMREGKSRKVRVGMFVEREYEPEIQDPEDWPTQH
jgi:Tfp pilus assembly protein PilP